MHGFTTGNTSTISSLINIKNAGTKEAHAIIVLDESSSMMSVAEATIKGFNEFLKTQQASQIATKVSLFAFNGNEVRVLIDALPAKDVPDLTSKSYRPSGMTNLHDAIGFAVERVNADLGDSAPSIEICIITDGEENTSRKYTKESVAALVKLCESKDWTFTFVGANIDAFAVGAKLGFGVDNSVSYGYSNIGNTMSMLATRTEAVKQARSVGLSAEDTYAATRFTEAQRNQAK